MMGTVAFDWVKGHGTGNDFVLLPDRDASIHGDLDTRLVAALCDRRTGIGADGVLRVVRSAAYPPAADVAGGCEWFMDYRNADGSTAETCGNGVRVFAAYLAAAGLVAPDQPLPVGTRGGVREVWPAGHGRWTAQMGRAELLAASVTVSVGGRGRWSGVGVRMPNPHAVVFVDDLADAGPLLSAPVVTAQGAGAPAFSDGVNVEFVVHRSPAHIALRVHERGVGETRSCGTGAAAAAVVAMTALATPDGTSYRVDVPGGRLEVLRRPDGEVEMTGPAVLVARGTVDPGWLAAVVPDRVALSRKAL